jgi:predicted DNA-binding protein
MPTLKKRIQIPVSDRVHKELDKLAKKRGVTVSSLTQDLVEEALELQEDMYFSKTGDKALEKSKDSELISHEEAWSS